MKLLIFLIFLCVLILTSACSDEFIYYAHTENITSGGSFTNITVEGINATNYFTALGLTITENATHIILSAN